MKRYYLAYGSNLYSPQMRYRCPTARLMGTAIIKDYELLFKESKTGAYLTIEPKQGAEVPVAVWEVKADYYKKEFQVTVKGIKSGRLRVRTAFAYILDESRAVGIPSIKYLNVCLAGYRKFGFNTRNLFDAYYISRREARI